MNTPVEVCLVSYASGEDLAHAINSVARHVPGAAIAVQEHAPTTASIEIAAAAAAECGLTFRARHDPSNRGFGAGCNSLASTSTAEWLLFLNPDAVITHWPFADDMPPQGTVWGPREIKSSRAHSHRGVSWTVLDELRRSWFRQYGPEPQGTGYVSGAALLVNRADHDRIGGFDEAFFLYFEDIEYCLRANRMGIGTRLADGWAIAHAGAHSTSSRFDRSLQWQYESAARLHHLQNEPLALYRAYVIADSGLRWFVHLLRRDGIKRRAYRAQLGRAAGDLVRKRNAP